jgi:uncharacterized iron-regulated membrane protein
MKQQPPDYSHLWFGIIVAVFWIIVAIVGTWWSRKD